MLEVDGLNAWWGGAQALFGISFMVKPGELVVLQGLNGAGKSTLLKSLMACGPRVEGAIRYDGADLMPLPSHARALSGLGYVPEDRRLFTDLTVLENLIVAARVPRDSAARTATPTRNAQLDAVLTMFPPLKNMLQRSAAQMSGGEQQMLSIARTLMTAPSVLLLDEPCEGIAPVLVESISAALLALKDRGMTLLVAEQNNILAKRADRLITLSAGQAVSAQET